MTGSIPDILARIVEQKRTELAEATVTLEDLERRAEANRTTKRGFRTALASSVPAIIAEVKKASPSKGLISADFDPPRIASAYQRGGAAAISVLTDIKFFQGSLDDLRAAREAVKLPVLRKDFTTAEYHVAEAAANGADAILLIASVLPCKRLRELREYAAAFGLDTLVEVHDERELQMAVESGAEIIGVNNRNLRTFEVTLETSLRLVEKIPATAVKVSESGIHSYSDIRTLAGAGFQAFLVGERLMKSGDPESALRALLQ